MYLHIQVERIWSELTVEANFSLFFSAPFAQLLKIRDPRRSHGFHAEIFEAAGQCAPNLWRHYLDRRRLVKRGIERSICRVALRDRLFAVIDMRSREIRPLVIACRVALDALNCAGASESAYAPDYCCSSR